MTTIREARTLARFATQSGRLTDEVVKPKLFEPNRKLELSVFRVEGLGYTEIQEITTDFGFSRLCNKTQSTYPSCRMKPCLARLFVLPSQK